MTRRLRGEAASRGPAIAGSFAEVVMRIRNARCPLVLSSVIAACVPSTAQSLSWTGTVTAPITLRHDVGGVTVGSRVVPIGTPVPPTGFQVGLTSNAVTYSVASLLDRGNVVGLRIDGHGFASSPQGSSHFVSESGGEVFDFTASAPVTGVWMVRYFGEHSGGPGVPSYGVVVDDGTGPGTMHVFGGGGVHDPHMYFELAAVLGAQPTRIRVLHTAQVGGYLTDHYTYWIEIRFVPGLSPVQPYGGCGAIRFYRNQVQTLPFLWFPFISNPAFLVFGLQPTSIRIPGVLCPQLTTIDAVVPIGNSFTVPVASLPPGMTVHAQAVSLDTRGGLLLSGGMKMTGL